MSRKHAKPSAPGSRPRLVVACEKCGRKLNWRARRLMLMCCGAPMHIEGRAPARSITLGSRTLPLPASVGAVT